MKKFNKWTREVPVEPGWYWFYVKKSDYFNIFRVSRDKENNLYVVGQQGDTVEDFSGYWLGPIPIPEKPDNSECPDCWGIGQYPGMPFCQKCNGKGKITEDL
jgi:hypothetical protein